MRRPLERSLTKFMEQPASPARAARVIVVATAAATFVGAIVVRLFDTSDAFDSFDDSLWYSLQTVTTVGYGDVVPTTAFGRIVGAVVMLFGIAFTAVVTASITSTFVEAARQRGGAQEQADAESAAAALHGRLDELVERLDRIESRLSDTGR
jgi:voltage-gated potassium channel